MTLLKQELKVNPFEGEIKPSEEFGLEQAVDEAIEEALIKLGKLQPEKTIHQSQDLLNSLDLPILKPAQIVQLFRRIHYDQMLTGLMMNKLIMDSYSNGENDFVLTTGDHKMWHFGEELSGQNDRQLRITVYGNLGEYCANHSKYCDYKINGHVDDKFGWVSEYCNIIVNGNMGKALGHWSKHCNFEIRGNIGYGFASESKESTYIFHGKVQHTQIPLGSINCTFTVFDGAAYNWLYRNNPGTN